MANSYFNGQTRNLKPTGMGKDTAQPCGAPMALKEKAGFAGGLPGKAQSKDRSGGVKRARPYPQSDGI